MTPGPKTFGRGGTSPDPASDLVVVGRIGKPHGVRGELCVHSHAQDPGLFDLLEHVHLLPGRPGGRPTPLTIRSWRDQGKHLVMRFSGIEDRDQAAALTNRDLAIARADLPEPDQDEVYLHQIVGFAVRDTQGTDLGVLDNFMESGGPGSGQEVWVLAHPSGREILLPAVEEVILEIDPDQGLIIADPPPGLVDLYLNEDAPQKKAKSGKPKSKKAGPARK